MVDAKNVVWFQTKHVVQNSKKINDHHPVNGSWGPGPRSPVLAKLQSGGHFKEDFLDKTDYQWLTQKMLCDFKQNMLSIFDKTVVNLRRNCCKSSTKLLSIFDKTVVNLRRNCCKSSTKLLWIFDKTTANLRPNCCKSSTKLLSIFDKTTVNLRPNCCKSSTKLLSIFDKTAAEREWVTH